MLKTIDEYNQDKICRFYIEQKMNYSTGVECPECKSELKYAHPNFILMSYPPKRMVVCSHCGFKTAILT